MNESSPISCPVEMFGFRDTNTEADNQIFMQKCEYPLRFSTFVKRLHDNRVEFSVFIESLNETISGLVSREIEIDGLRLLIENPLPNTAIPIVFKRFVENIETGSEDPIVVDFVFADTLYFEPEEIKSYSIAGVVRRFAARGIDLPADKTDFADREDFIASFFATGYEDTEGGYLDLNEDALYYDDFDIDVNRSKRFEILGPGGSNTR